MTMVIDALSKSLAKYSSKIESKVNSGKKHRLPGGLSDVFNVFEKHGARSNAAFLARLDELSIDVFKKRNQCKNFDEIAKLIVVNIDLETRTFCSEFQTQQQIGDQLKLDQSTISRHLSLMVRAGIIRHAFTGSNDPRDPKAGLVCDKNGIPFNNIYYVNDDFALLAGKTAGNKLIDAFRKRDEAVTEKDGTTLFQRVVNVRNKVWEDTIKSRLKGISAASITETIQGITNRSEAVSIIRKRVEKRGDLVGMSAEAQSTYINALLKQHKFNNSGSPGALAL